MPPEAYLYAIPYEYYESIKFAVMDSTALLTAMSAPVGAELMGKNLEEDQDDHLPLGNGSSITAIKDGKVIDTSMGLTPLDGS